MMSSAETLALAALRMVRDTAWPHMPADAMRQVTDAIVALEGIAEAEITRRIKGEPEAMAAVDAAWKNVPISIRLIPALTEFKRAVRNALSTIHANGGPT